MTRRDKLQNLLMQRYVAGVLCHERRSDDDQERLLSTVLAAAEGRDLQLLGAPFPKDAIGIAYVEGYSALWAAVRAMPGDSGPGRPPKA